MSNHTFHKDQIYSVDKDGEVKSGYDNIEQQFSATNKLQEWQTTADVEFATVSEKIALADHNIQLWTNYKQMIKKPDILFIFRRGFTSTEKKG